MAPKRKCTEAKLDEHKESPKRQLRSSSRLSRSISTSSSPTKADTTISQRAQLKTASKAEPRPLPQDSKQYTQRLESEAKASNGKSSKRNASRSRQTVDDTVMTTTEPAPTKLTAEEQAVQNVINLHPEVFLQGKKGRPRKAAAMKEKQVIAAVQPQDDQQNDPSDWTTDNSTVRRSTRRGVEVVITKPGSASRLPPQQPSISPPSRSDDAVSTKPGHSDRLPSHKPLPDSLILECLATHDDATNSREHLSLLLSAQKKVVMASLRTPSLQTTHVDDGPSVNDSAIQQLQDLLRGTTERAEGNSCLLLGPRGTGKYKMVDKCLDNLQTMPIVLRLSGYVQCTDRHALREIAYQLLQQTGSSLLPESESGDLDINPNEENPFLEPLQDLTSDPATTSLSLPPSSHLHSLVPLLLTLKRPVVVVLDAFDLFALHPRQALLYCLLDTVQNCRASSENRGIAVIGITSRVDTIQLLEKRVKSRFSGRTIRTAPPSDYKACLAFVRSSLLVPLANDTGSKHVDDWNKKWSASVETFLEDREVSTMLREMFSISKDVNVTSKVLTNAVVRLSPAKPYLSHKLLSDAVESQRSRSQELHFTSLSYPSICLLIASIHINTSGQRSFTFEMLFELFHDEMRASMSAPVQVNGGGIGLMRCTREVMMNAFENLTCAKIFAHTTAPSSNTAKEFVKYRSCLDRNVVKKIVDKNGKTHLKKWFHKAH